MRMWEWGRVLFLLKEIFGYPFKQPLAISEGSRISILDIGTAVSLIGPALAYLGLDVYETDVDLGWQKERLKLKTFLDTFKPAGIFSWTQAGFGTLHERCGKRQYEVVMSISTIEHVETSLEKAAWKEMADLVKPGGLLIVTMDCFEFAKKGYKYDDVRFTNYSMDTVKDRVTELKSYGFFPIGKEDYKWHGVFVDDGSFACINMRKKK
jgi:hypothetical protein